MAGMDTQIGFAEEATYGTYVPPTKFYEFVPPESLKRSAERVESKALRPGEFVLASSRWEEGRVGAEGDVEFEVLDQGSAFLWKHSLGKVTTTQPDVSGSPTVYEHKAEVASLNGSSLSAQIGRPDVTDTLVPFNYVGLKVAQWELSMEMDGTLSLKWSLDGADELDETDGGPIVAPTFDDVARLLVWAGGTLSIDGVELEAKSFNLQGSNALKTDRFYLRGDGSRVKREQLRNGRNEYTGTVTVDWEGRTLYDKFVDGATASLKAEFLGRTLPGTPSLRAGVVVDLGAIRVDGETPNIGDEDVAEQSVPFTVTYDRTAAVSPVIVTVTDELDTP